MGKSVNRIINTFGEHEAIRIINVRIVRLGFRGQRRRCMLFRGISQMAKCRLRFLASLQDVRSMRRSDIDAV